MSTLNHIRHQFSTIQWRSLWEPRPVKEDVPGRYWQGDQGLLRHCRVWQGPGRVHCVQGQAQGELIAIGSDSNGVVT